MNTEETIVQKKSMPAHIKTGLRIIGGIVLVGLIFLGGVYVGYDNRAAFAKVTDLIHPATNTTDTAPASPSTVDLSEFWKVWQIVNENFAPATSNATKVTDQDHLYGAIQGLVASFGDPYTTFFPPSENTQFQAQIAGEFSGIGIQIGQKNNALTVIAPLKGTPAEKAGIKAGDIITKIDDTDTSTITIDRAVDLIQGKSGTTVTLTIARENIQTPLTFTITRSTISLPTLDTETRFDKGVFIIHLYSFDAQSAQLFRQAMNSYLASGYHNLLLDLRGNPGGYLDAAVSIGSEFIPQGKIIVKEIGKDPKDVTVHTSTGPVIFPSTDKLVILANQGSASASEILAGALSQNGIGTLVGQQTFGKGSVQEVVPLTDNTSLKVTVAHWYTPDGTSISAKGLTPKISIPVDATAKTDTQLEGAIDVFKSLR